MKAATITHGDLKTTGYEERLSVGGNMRSRDTRIAMDLDSTNPAVGQRLVEMLLDPAEFESHYQWCKQRRAELIKQGEIEE